MLLALRSTIDSEIDWALSRIVRLTQYPEFLPLKSIPGILDALFDWPEWYIENWDKLSADQSIFTNIDHDLRRNRTRALNALVALRNASLTEANMVELADNPRTRKFIIAALHNLDRTRDTNQEFLVHVIDLLYSLAGGLIVSPNSPNPIRPLEEIAATSPNRALILTSLQTLMRMINNPLNAPNLSPDSPALHAALRYLPLFEDRFLLSAALEYLQAYLSNQAMAKAFLLHPSLAPTLRLLATLLHRDQVSVTTSVDIPQSVTVSLPLDTKPAELSVQQIEALAALEEPERCQNWFVRLSIICPSVIDGVDRVRLTFDFASDNEMSQAEFYTSYTDIFRPYSAERPMLSALDSIKALTMVHPQVQAMVVEGPPSRFVIRHIIRKSAPATDADGRRCKWNPATCGSLVCQSPSDLRLHVRDHILSLPEGTTNCPWSSCTRTTSPEALVRHILTHLPSAQKRAEVPGQRVFSQAAQRMEWRTDPSIGPPPEDCSFEYKVPKDKTEPPTTSLTALLILRSLFRTAFVSGQAAMRADDDHFGFPGQTEEVTEIEETPGEAEVTRREMQGERRGRAAFIGIREMLASVQFAQPQLQDWVVEMADATLGDIELDEDM